jgi:hypothetical protein
MGQVGHCTVANVDLSVEISMFKREIMIIRLARKIVSMEKPNSNQPYRSNNYIRRSIQSNKHTMKILPSKNSHSAINRALPFI